MSATDPPGWPRVAWALVHPGDRVYAADQRIWDVVKRDGGLVTIERRDGGMRRRMSRVNPPGDVPCLRGTEWRVLVAAVGVFRDAGFSVEYLGTTVIPGLDVREPVG